MKKEIILFAIGFFAFQENCFGDFGVQASHYKTLTKKKFKIEKNTKNKKVKCGRSLNNTKSRSLTEAE